MTEINKVPHSLTSTWQTVAKDGVIDKNDIEQLKHDADMHKTFATIAIVTSNATAEQIESVSADIKAEQKFIGNLETELTKTPLYEKKVKPGSAAGTFELIDENYKTVDPEKALKIANSMGFKSVTELQKKHGLQEDGIMGLKTVRKLENVIDDAILYLAGTKEFDKYADIRAELKYIERDLYDPK
jgi:murein L,D-transpeptidase YcbB/YkuD